jgi:hypothetical protein
MNMEATVKKEKPLRTYYCHFKGTDKEFASPVIARSASSARYNWYRSLDFGPSYREEFKNIRSFSGHDGIDNSIHQRLRRVVVYRGIPAVKVGTRVVVSGNRQGTVVGGNHSMNLDIILDGQDFSGNYHPKWEIAYFDENGETIYDFRSDGRK